MTNINCRVCMSPKTCTCICQTCIRAKCMLLDGHEVDYKEYLLLRQLGLRAVSAFIVAKYGLEGLLYLILDEDIAGV